MGPYGKLDRQLRKTAWCTKICLWVQCESYQGTACGDGHILLSFAHVGDGVRPDAATRLQAPQQGAVGRIEREEVALHVARKHHAACCRKHARPRRRLQPELPLSLPGHGVERAQ